MCPDGDAALLQVAFKLFGLLPGAVGLRGRVVPVPAGQPHGPVTAGERDTVRVLFEPPVLSFGDSLHFRIGGLVVQLRRCVPAAQCTVPAVGLFSRDWISHARESVLPAAKQAVVLLCALPTPRPSQQCAAVHTVLG